MIKNKISNKINKHLFITVIVLIVFIDIFSKYLIMQYIKLYDTKKIFFMLNFFHIHNYGAAFSLLSNQNGWQRWFLSVVSLIIIYIIIDIAKTFKVKEKRKKLACSLIIGGAIGNLINRVFSGFVIDFIDLHIHNYHYATFNIADCSIFFGIITFLVSMVKYSNHL